MSVQFWSMFPMIASSDRKCLTSPNSSSTTILCFRTTSGIGVWSKFQFSCLRNMSHMTAFLDQMFTSTVTLILTHSCTCKRTTNFMVSLCVSLDPHGHHSSNLQVSQLRCTSSKKQSQRFGTQSRVCIACPSIYLLTFSHVVTCRIRGRAP